MAPAVSVEPGDSGTAGATTLRDRIALGASLSVQIVLILWAFRALNRTLLRFLKSAPEEWYFESIPSLAMLRNGPRPMVLLGFAVVCIAAAPRLGWRSFPAGKPLRVFITILALALAWTFSAYDFNFYYDQGHYFDRVLVVILAALTAVNPAFVPLFLIAVFVMMAQFKPPLYAAYSITDKRLLFELLALFALFLPVRLLAPFRLPARIASIRIPDRLRDGIRLDERLFVFLAICFVGRRTSRPGSRRSASARTATSGSFTMTLPSRSHGDTPGDGSASWEPTRTRRSPAWCTR